MVLVSAIMPTRGRPDMAEIALRCFLAQIYPLKELVILDDEDEPSFPYGVLNSEVNYLRATGRLPIAIKRNKCCEAAKGEVICHFDSDDWSHPNRIADQVERMESSGKSVTGYHSLAFHNGKDAWKYHGVPSYALGTSLCYRREWWQANPFTQQMRKGEPEAWGEDNLFVKEAKDRGQLLSVDGELMIVARIHPGNTSHKHIEGREYRPFPRESLPQGFQ